MRLRSVWSPPSKRCPRRSPGSRHRSENSSTHTPTRRYSRAYRGRGIVRAAKLLAEIGDCRERFPTDDALAALAGASPSTRQSGKHGQTVFRWSCNKKLRRAVMDFANGSRLGDEWAMQVCQRASARGCRHPHAIDDPRTRLDPHHLALLARRNPLQSATAHQPKTLGCSLT